mgnify:CR=1 FL=1
MNACVLDKQKKLNRNSGEKSENNLIESDLSKTNIDDNVINKAEENLTQLNNSKSSSTIDYYNNEYNSTNKSEEFDYSDNYLLQ